MALEKTFNKLQINLYKSFIFYIPKNIFPAEQLDLIEDVDQFLDKVFFLNEYGAIYEFKNQPVLVSILLKQQILDGNLFKLLDRKEKIKNPQIDFFTKKYIEKVHFCFYLSKWLNDNLASYDFEINEEVKSAFQYQYHFFQQHFEQLNEHFNSNEKSTIQPPINIGRLIDNNFEELKESLFKRYDNGDLKTVKESQNKLQVENPPNSKKRQKKEKPAMITEQEAEDFLFETVFNLKI